MKKIKLAYLLLGIGCGIVLASGLYFLFPEVRYKDVSDEVIIERAKELGYVSLKESLEKEVSKDIGIEDEKLEENKEDKEKEGAKDIGQVDKSEEKFDEDSIEIEIKPGENLSDIARKLLDAGLIRDIEEFKLLARSKGVDKKLSYGVYDFKYNTSYSTIIKILNK